MRTRALVLAGGGLVGIAWELGVLLGLRQAGADVETWHRVIGTSAGSVVGAAVGSPDGLDALRSADWVESAHQLNEYLQTLDRACIEEIDALWFEDPAGPDQTTRAEIGRLALAAHTDHEARFIGAIAKVIQTADWPARLVTTAVDAQDGAFTTFDRDSGVPVTTAVAASCAIPGVFPPVTIAGRRYVDGGVRSGASADLATGLSLVVLISPARTEEGSSHGRQAAEVAILRANGSRVVEISPDDPALAFLRQEFLDPAALPAVIEAGIVLGVASAPRLG
jgi:NTE family protein